MGMNALRAHRTLKTPYNYPNRFLYIVLPCVTPHMPLLHIAIISALRRFKRPKVNHLLKHGSFGHSFSLITPCNNCSMLTISQSPTHQLPCLLTPTPHTLPYYQAPYILRCFGVLNYDLPTLKIVLDPLMYNHAISIASRNMYMMKTSLTIAQAIVGDVSSWRKRYLVALLCRLNTNISYLNRSLTHYYGSNKKLYNFVCASPIAD